MSEAEVINYMRQICEAIRHMHEKNIIHLDIKPENIMCQTKHSTNVKLIDFGLATKLDPNEVVKISTGTAEFAAPEIVEREPVGFYTDMWAVGVLAYVLLSGLSPFAGDNDVETLKNVKACDWDFDEEAFANVSSEGKDFIKRLLVKNKEKRMTAHECLLHSWLTGDHSDRSAAIKSSCYTNIRNKIRMKYQDWDSFAVPIGRLSEYSALRKLHLEKYRIHDTSFDRRQAAPRFVIKPASAFAYEGQSVKFYCRVIAIAQPTLSWYHNNQELRQSVKFMKRYAQDDYTFVINRVKCEDRGEYIIRAENHYGFREEVVFLNVQPLPKVQPPAYKQPEAQPIRRREPLAFSFWIEERESAPCFTFLLRPRVMQCRQTCKLLCCLSGKPFPTVKWFKGSKELNKHDYNMSHSDGVVFMEIVDCKPEDSGKYQCVATNIHGQDETSCVVIVEGYGETEEQATLAHNYMYSGDRRYIEQPLRTIPNTVTKKTLIGTSGGSSSATSTGSKYGSSAASGAAEKKPKKYGMNKSSYDASSPSRSRSATKELVLPPDDSMCPPEITNKLPLTIVVNDGESLDLSCTLRGDPDPRVTWLKNGQVLTSSNVVDLKYRNGIASLRITEIYPEDEGEYICRASNSLGQTETKCILSVKIPPSSKMQTQVSSSDGPDVAPRIVSHLTSQFVKDGDPVVLSVRIIGAQKFDVVWLHNNKEIKPSKDFQYTSEANIYKLNIVEIFPEDSGIYTCEAFNDVGESFSSCSLTVLVPNEEPKTPFFKTFPRSATVQEGESVSFDCEIEKDPTGVIWLKDGKPIEDDSTRYQFVQNGKHFQFKILSSTLNDIGQYLAKASDKSGETSASFALNVFSV
ncbi:hypothetical protein LSTR_LSTR004189 [Laodelphax striatellus]|uniref:Twitchin n=1 Tax=Laodelphax striatellus TaxID=195883 RepID=A0A482XAP9_LAOST|nr:hypothetical protein LSTR_LSTR004189 [Laodelphax striatellus]